MKNTKSTRLVYSNQLEFKAFARRHGLTYKNGVDYYFDNIYCVDATDKRQPNINSVRCDGSLTFGEAIDRLKKHFKIAV